MPIRTDNVQEDKWKLIIFWPSKRNKAITMLKVIIFYCLNSLLKFRIKKSVIVQAPDKAN